jgi:hypothetical protein
MKLRLLTACFTLASLAAADPAAATSPLTATTVKKSTVTVGSAILPLTPGTRLEVLGREGDSLIIKFRSTKGRVPLGDTDFNPATPLPEPTSPAVPVPAKPAAKAPPPATLNPSSTSPQPATNYGKAVQKAQQATEARKSNLVDPTKDILDETPKR